MATKRAGAPNTMEHYLRALQGHADSRAAAVFALTDELLAYRAARAALTGPALADWTERYEQRVRQLVVHGLNGLNEVFDTGSWPRIVQRLAKRSPPARGEDLFATLQAAVRGRFGERAAAAIGSAASAMAGSTITTARSGNGVRVTVSRDGQSPVSVEITPHREMGDRPRLSASALLGPRPAFAIQRRGGARQRGRGAGADLGAIDFYGAVVGIAGGLLDHTRREVRTARRFGRVRVQGEVPLIILAIWAVAVIALWTSYLIACTGVVNPDNASNQDSDACKVLDTIARIVTAAIPFLLLAIFSGATNYQNEGGAGSSNMAYTLNPPDQG
jgi:hypothetical protein